jgi:type IX secretion system PorP/SprF family membrane protein
VNKYLFLFFVFLLNVFILQAQDPQFTQFYSNKMYLAPSFVGATQQNRVASTIRDQWLGLPNSFITYTLSYEHYFSNFNSGLGVIIMRDQAGAGNLNLTELGLQYSYDFKIFETWHVRPGIQFAYLRRGLNFDDLLFGDQLKEGENSSSSGVEAPTLGGNGGVDGTVSGLLYSPLLWVGASVDHLLRPNISLSGEPSRVPIKTSIFGGYTLIKKSRLLNPIDETLSLAFLFKAQDYKKQLDLGLYWYKSPLMLGFWYRGIPVEKWNRGDALAMLIGIKTRSFSVGYSYDFTVSHLVNSTNGAHEISLIWEFRTERRKKLHAIPCPEF